MAVTMSTSSRIFPLLWSLDLSPIVPSILCPHISFSEIVICWKDLLKIILSPEYFAFPQNLSTFHAFMTYLTVYTLSLVVILKREFHQVLKTLTSFMERCGPSSIETSQNGHRDFLISLCHQAHCYVIVIINIIFTGRSVDRFLWQTIIWKTTPKKEYKEYILSFFIENKE